MPWNQLVAYVILCLIAGLLGHKRAIGFWGCFVLSIFVTPLIVTIVLAITSYRRVPAHSRS